jgi:hypothetical protein
MVSMLVSSVVHRGFEPWSGQIKDYKIGICCFSTKYTAQTSKSWLAQNQNNVSEWSNISTHRLLFRWASTIKIQLSVLVYNKANLIIISLKINLFMPIVSDDVLKLSQPAVIVLFAPMLMHLLQYILLLSLSSSRIAQNYLNCWKSFSGR